MLQKSLNLAIQAHSKQIDKGGSSYINHPIYLALQMDNDEEKSVALLHDVVEDTYVTLQDIEDSISPNISYIVNILTHKENETYFEYISRIKNSANPIAIKVKVADLKHNMDLSRINNPTEKDLSRIKRYEKALNILERND